MPVRPIFSYFTILLILREIGSLHLENPPVPVGPRNYRFTDFARNPEKIPPSLFTFNRIVLHGLSSLHLENPPVPVRPRFYYFTILLFCYFAILLFYYFTILLILREIGSLHLENPPVPVGPRNYRFTDFARNPEKIPPCLFTFNRISSTGSAVCISKTHLCRSDPDFTILLFY